MIELPRLISALHASWDEKTSYYHDNRQPLSAGQCAVTSLIVQDYLGGEIIKTKINGTSHYYNLINNQKLDLTADQFPQTNLDTPSEIANRKDFERETLERYFILKARVYKYLRLTAQMKQ